MSALTQKSRPPEGNRLSALCAQGKPLSTGLVAEYVMRARGVARDDPEIRTRCKSHVRVALMRLERTGRVRKLISEPEAWWELVGGMGI
jgi:hypothetical protein